MAETREGTLWERAVRERAEAASRFGPPAQLVAARLPKAAPQCSLAEIMAVVVRLRQEYGLGGPVPLYDPRNVPKNVPTDVPTCISCERVPEAGRKQCSACRKAGYRRGK